MGYISNLFAAVRGRPRAIEGEKMVVGRDLIAASTGVGQGGVYFLPVDEIIKRQGWRTYKQMINDDQVKACIAFKKILIHGRAWELAPSDESEQAKRVAKIIEKNLRDINFNHVVKEALSALEFGYSVGELVWARKDIDGVTYILLEKIAHRDPEDLELKLDNHGNFIGVKQQVTSAVIEVEANKLWHYAHDSRFGNPYGNSDLRAAYRSWWAKKFIINFWNVFLERMGSPMTKMSYPLGATDELKATLKQILKNLSSKTEVLVPQGVEVELIEARRAGNASYDDALKYHNDSIARAILMVALLGMKGESGRDNDSQSALHLRLLFKMADEIAQNLTATFCKQVIAQMIEMNFPEGTEAPRFIWQDYGQFEGMKVADTIRLLHAAGILDMDQKDVNYARSILGLPLRLEGEAEDEVVRPQPLPPPADANSPPPPANQGNDRAKKGGDNAAGR